jgi:BirA family biotin operon repressor/biotin-[acetyl-CoA-carboxylase] ligase
MIDKTIQKIFQINKYDFFHTESTKSTMSDVKNFLTKNNRNCIYLSDKQSEGRGRRGNYWHSPPGNIYCSISFDNFLNIKDHFLYSILICITIKETLEKFNSSKIKFKWPNDIFYENKKFAGIITETFNFKNLNPYMITGFGINFISSPVIKNYESTYIKSFSTVKNINDFLEIFFKLLFINLKKLKKKDITDLINDYSNSLMFINKIIKISLPNNLIVSGKFKGVNGDGSLQLESNNNIKNIYNGSIIL